MERLYQELPRLFLIAQAISVGAIVTGIASGSPEMNTAAVPCVFLSEVCYPLQYDRADKDKLLEKHGVKQYA